MSLDPDRVLALSYVPAARRPAVEALWRLDGALGAALAGGREPLIGQIKLAWWREALEKLDSAAPPAEPVLEGVATHVLPGGVRGSELARMEEGWTLLLSPDPLMREELGLYARARGGLLFRYTARLLGFSGEPPRGGEAWALVDLARHANPADAEAAMEAAGAAGMDRPWPSRLRPLGMLAALALRDLDRPRWEEQGSPGRMLRMLRHRITGR